MKLQEYRPIKALEPYIKCYRIINSEALLVNRVLPNTSITMAFQLRGEVSYVNSEKQIPLPATSLSGLRKSVRLIRYEPKSTVLVVLFKETALPAFFKHPIHELFEESIALDSLLSSAELSRLEDTLAASGDYGEKIAVVERFLLSRLREKHDELVTEAVARIRLSGGQVKISKLAESLYISQDAFEKRFRKTTGSSPKDFASIIKLQTVINVNKRDRSLAPVALNGGYFDQAHFNRAFKRFTGLTPGVFFKAPVFW